MDELAKAPSPLPPTSILPGNSSKANCSLSCTDLSHLVFSCHNLPPAHGTWNLVVRLLHRNNLLSSPGKQIQRKEISFPLTKPVTSVCPPSGEPGNNISPFSRPNSLTCLPLPNPGGVWSNLFLVFVPPPSPPSPQTATRLTPHVKKLNASTLCLPLNLVSQTHSSLYPPYPAAPGLCVLSSSQGGKDSVNPRL